eukprot:Anaeramoba_ignava/a221942_10.p1 GENE.a221942_10~~a221942_10.p1  ORF type:complete len:238 (+),score=29.40 a221942_10:884-1597(+)
MNGKQLFCISLILLSVAMGIQWSKHKPKTPKKKKNRPRVALNLEDLQIKDEEDANKKDTDGNESSDDQNQDQNPEDGENTEAIASNTVSASATTDIASQTTGSDTSQIATETDPVILAFMNLKRNPFQKSPYAKLVEEIRALQQQTEDPEDDVQKTVEKINAKFDSTIKSKGKLIAIIDSQLYREGDKFNGRRITKITRELVSIDSPSSLWLIPKVGTELAIASDGTYKISDPFLDN